jgi:WD40 repeat protein
MVAFDASSQTLYAASNFGFLRGWDTSDWRETATIATEGRPLWAFDPAQGRALLQGDGLPQLRDRDGRTRELPVNGVVMRAAFDADGGRLALAMSMFPYLTVWDTERIQIVQAIPTGPLLRVAWRRPGEVIAVEQDRPHVEFWTLGAREPSRVIEGERLPFDGPSAGVGGRIVTLGGWDRTVRTWIDDAKEPIIARGHTYYVITTAVSPSGALIASGGLDRTVRIWDATTGAELWRLARQSADVWSLAFAPDSRLLAVGLRDGQVLVLDVAEDGRTLGELSGLATCRVPFAFARGDTRLEESLPRCDGIPRASDGSP